MEGNKLEISGRVADDPPPATYKQIPESDVEEGAKERPKSLTKSLVSNSEMDGADEQMLPKDEKVASPESKIDVGDIKFTNNEKQNGEAKLDIGEIKTAFVGMSKEELMKFATDPFWVRLRWILFVSFWLLWLAMLVGAIIIIIAAPKCAPPEPRTWYEEGPLTTVNHDISQEKLQELKDRKIRGVIVSQLEDTYKPANDSMEIYTFLQRAKKLELNVIVELEPASSSMWFDKSESKDEKYNNYYIWESSKKNNESGDPEPPNNWISPKGTTSWLYSQARNQFYYAPNTSPHLNFRNPQVVDEFSDIIRQWIDAGARGILLKGAPFLLIDDKLQDEMFGTNPSDYVHTDYEFYKHTKTTNVEGIAEILLQWKKVVKEYNENQGPLMIAEDLHSLDAYILNDTLSIDLPRHSKLFLSNDKLSNATAMFKDLKTTMSIIKDYWPLWEYGRDITSLSADVLNMLTMLLPGSPLIPFDTNANNTVELVKIRENPSIMFGATYMELLANNTIFAYLRVASGNPGYLVACNPSEKTISVDFTLMRNVSDEVTVQSISPNYVPKIELNLKIAANEVIMAPKSAIVLTYVPKSGD